MSVRTISLAVAALLALSAETSQAASITVVPEGGNVFRYELKLDPDESVAVVQFDLVIQGATVDILDTGFLVPLTLPGEFWIADPWASSSVFQVANGNLRIANRFDGRRNPDAGLTGNRINQPDGSHIAYIEFIDADLGIFADFRDPSYEPGMDIPIARVRVIAGAAPRQWRDAICGTSTAGDTCNIPESGIVSEVPETTAACLLALSLAYLRAMRLPAIKRALAAQQI